jgi:hypothetical protein
MPLAATLAGLAADLGGHRFRLATGYGELAIWPALGCVPRLALQAIVNRVAHLAPLRPIREAKAAAACLG